jgi:plastocyanin
VSSAELLQATRRFAAHEATGRAAASSCGLESMATHSMRREREHEARRGEAKRGEATTHTNTHTHTHTRTLPSIPSQNSQQSTPQDTNKIPKHTYTPRARRVSYTALGETRNSVPKLFGVMFKEGQGNTPRLAQTWVGHKWYSYFSTPPRKAVTVVPRKAVALKVLIAFFGPRRVTVPLPCRVFPRREDHKITMPLIETEGKIIKYVLFNVLPTATARRSGR